MTTNVNWKFVLSQTDGQAIYQQIMDQVQQHVAVNDLPQGAKLPSIRELARTLNVSLITVKRAYLELERIGVIVTQHGKGSWVAEGHNHSRLQLDELERCLERAAGLAAAMDISAVELAALLGRYTNE